MSDKERDEICISLLASQYNCTKERAFRVWEICKDIPKALSKLADHIIKIDAENKILKSKQLSIDELRKQFEKELAIKKNALWDSKIKCYVFKEIQREWFVYLTCARANNLIKDGN